MSKPFVAILMGSDSDLPIMEASFDVLNKLGVPFEAKVTSAHRTPAVTHDYVTSADERGCAAFICAAGMAAHLAGGLDALLSTVQMPGGIPVATVAIGKAGAKNAAYLAAQIIAGADPALHQRLLDERAANAQIVIEKDQALQDKLQARAKA